MDNEDFSRMSLLLTDVLCDMKIRDRNNKLWTPVTVTRAVKDPKAGGLLWLASKLLGKLQRQGLDESHTKDTTTVKLTAWEDLHKQFERFCPPWVTAKDLSEKPAISRLEVLLFLASTLQNRMLRKQSSNQGQTASTDNNSNATNAASGSDSSGILALPAHLTSEQREIVLLCYSAIQADYDKRRTGMKQRLNILVSDFEADNPGDQELAELQTKLQKLTLSSSNHATIPDLSNEELVKHFTAPHSQQASSSKHHNSSKSSAASSPLDNLLIVDRGGRTDDVESRVAVMPEWSTSRS